MALILFFGFALPVFAASPPGNGQNQVLIVHHGRSLAVADIWTFSAPLPGGVSLPLFAGAKNAHVLSGKARLQGQTLWLPAGSTGATVGYQIPVGGSGVSLSRAYDRAHMPAVWFLLGNGVTAPAILNSRLHAAGSTTISGLSFQEYQLIGTPKHAVFHLNLEVGVPATGNSTPPTPVSQNGVPLPPGSQSTVRTGSERLLLWGVLAVFLGGAVLFYLRLFGGRKVGGNRVGGAGH